MTRRGEPRARSSPVVVVSQHGVLGPALAAALVAAGWTVVRVQRWDLLGDDVRHDRDAGVVLVADEAGQLPSGPPPGSLRSPTAPVVAVGRRADARELVRAVERGAVAAVDSDQPVVDLVRAVDTLLRDPTTWPDRRALLGRLRRRIGRAAALASLTPRELATLGALMAGMTAAEISRTEHVALTTVRAHVRAVLQKTGVSSQVAAVALAHAFGAGPGFDALRARLHEM